MPFQITACSIAEMHPHPIFRDRTKARIKVTLRETGPRPPVDHALTVNVWTDNEGRSADAIREALIVKAAAILKRTAERADRAQPRPLTLAS